MMEIEAETGMEMVPNDVYYSAANTVARIL